MRRWGSGSSAFLALLSRQLPGRIEAPTHHQAKARNGAATAPHSALAKNGFTTKRLTEIAAATVPGSVAAASVGQKVRAPSVSRLLAFTRSFNLALGFKLQMKV